MAEPLTVDENIIKMAHNWIDEFKKNYGENMGMLSAREITSRAFLAGFKQASKDTVIDECYTADGHPLPNGRDDATGLPVTLTPQRGK